MDKEKADKEYLDKFLADVEKLKNEKILITAKVKTGEVEIKPQKAVEVYCIDSQGKKRTLEEIHSVFSGSISYKAEKEQRKKLGIKINP